MRVPLRSWLAPAACLLLASLTLYLVLRYAFVHPPNHCRMTFMMELPKFLPVPLQDHEISPAQQHYQLFIYSEFDFPRSSNPNEDLKDSMPVLFVPGNAGSYQQTRSLASTCIRMQLRSLEAAKFVFYTVSFGEQMSGINGNLLIEQIDFVGKAIQQIKTNHPDLTGGIILIGHSVGGFISKAVIAKSDFPQDSVGLIISLAGPLISLPLFFDEDVRNLYERTNQRWKQMANKTELVAISISGGYSDRLVPPQFATDETFDVSITTSALSGVWLPTDHVPITWCRELMQKLSIVMSSVMDKRHIRLIPVERRQMIDTIKTQFIGSDDVLTRPPNLELGGNWTSTRSFNIMGNELFYHEQLVHELKILNIEPSHDLFVIIEHVENLPQSWIAGCNNRIQNALLCTRRIQLSNLARGIPSRYYEPKTTFLIVPSSLGIMSVIVDLVPDYNGTNFMRTPETFSHFQIASQDYVRNIYLPTMFEYVWIQLISLFTGKQSFHEHIDAKPGSPLRYMRFYLTGFKHFTQTFVVTLGANSCTKKITRRVLILFRAPWSLESYHSPYNNENLSRLSMNLRLMKTRVTDESAYLELFIDGTCKYDLSFRFNFFELFDIVVQHRLGSVLGCIAMLLILSIKKDFKTISGYEKKGENEVNTYAPNLYHLDPVVRLVIDASSMALVLAMSSHILNLLAPNIRDSDYNLTDEIVIILSIYVLSSGAIILSRFILRTFIWLATRVSFCFYRNESSNGAAFNFYNLKTIDISGLILVIAIVLGVFWCSFWLSLATSTIFVIKSVKNKRNSMDNSDSLYHAISRLDINMLLLTILCVVPAVPDALISLQDKQTLAGLTTSKIFDHLVSIPALILAYKFMHRTFESTTTQQIESDMAISNSITSSDMHMKTIQNLRGLFFLPVLLIESNVYFLSVTQLTTLIWLACS